jgi:hypothetical protein
MGRINQDIVEYSFSSKSTLSYELNLLVGADSVYYMVNDAQLNVLALKSFHNDRKKDRTQLTTFKDAFFEDILLKEPYRVSKIVFTTPHFTFVPNKFYNETEHATYFQNLTDFTEDTAFEADSMKNLDFTNVYAIEKNIQNFTQSTFPLAKRFHVFSALIQGCQKMAEVRNGHQIFANVRDGFVQILFFDGKELIFANAFPFQTPQDLIYFIMMVYEQFKLNPESIPLSISGNMTEDSDIFKYIYRYVRLVNFIKAPTYFRLGQEFTGVPQHFYFDLFSIKLCE